MIRHIRQPFRLATALAALLSLAGCCDKNPDTRAGTSAATHAAPAKVNLLVGTYTEGPASSGKSKGIPVFCFDTTTGEAVKIADNDGIRNPSWVVVTPSGRHVYAVNELNGTGKSGEVSAFDFDAPSGRLTFLNKVSSEGDDPCHLLLDKPHGLLFVSNYTGGTTAAFPIQKSTGSLAKSDNQWGRGSGEMAPHIHSVAMSPAGNLLFEQDLGFNSITLLHIESPTDNHPAGWKPIISTPLILPEGTGPRHLIFNTFGSHGYLIGETNDTVTVLLDTRLYADPVNLNATPLAPVQTVLLGAPVAPGKGTAAAIHLSDDGKFLYASTRNPKNILVVFTVNPTDGTLREIQTVSSGGKAPREFTIAPGGKFLLVANQQSDAIAVFSRDPETGKITDTGRRIPVGSPTDLKWAPAQ